MWCCDAHARSHLDAIKRDESNQIECGKMRRPVVAHHRSHTIGMFDGTVCSDTGWITAVYSVVVFVIRRFCVCLREHGECTRRTGVSVCGKDTNRNHTATVQTTLDWVVQTDIGIENWYLKQWNVQFYRNPLYFDDNLNFWHSLLSQWEYWTSSLWARTSYIEGFIFTYQSIYRQTHTLFIWHL